MGAVMITFPLEKKKKQDKRVDVVLVNCTYTVLPTHYTIQESAVILSSCYLSYCKDILNMNSSNIVSISSSSM